MSYSGNSPASPALNAARTAQIQTTIARLRALTQVEVQTNWRWDFTDWSSDQLQAILPADWAIAPLNHRQHIAWKAGQQTVWLYQRVIIPPDLEGYDLAGLTLRLTLTWWAEAAQIFVNDELVQEGDLFDCSARVLLSSSVQVGQGFTVAIRLVSPGHDDGALVRSRLVYETAEDAAVEPGFVADELEVLWQYLKTFEPEKLDNLAAAIERLDWSGVKDRDRFHHSLQQCRQELQPLGDWLKQRQICYLGHAHLDLAWLWPIGETWEAAERTFRSVLNLKQEFPDLRFGHSSPVLYDWLERHRPELFARIQTRIAAGSWEVIAGLWVEPELNLISGESLVRQVLYGQRYVQEKFGQVSRIAWLPDSFGFCWQLPQILKQGGVDYFVTQKLRWNDTTQFSHPVFWWRSPDGTQIFSLMSPPIGEGIDPVKMATYACEWEQQTGVPASFWLPGVGDHGGGPTRDMLEVAHRWQQSPLFPHLKSITTLDYLQGLEQALRSRPEPLPVWNDELYLEFHRGCYTTHADQKRRNRRCEDLLYQAELYATLATVIAGSAYPQAPIEMAWKHVLFNQFHDILPGSAIPEVYVDADQDWTQAEQMGTEIRQRSLRAIANQIALPPSPHPQALPFVVFNSLNWARSQVISIPLPESPECNLWQVRDHRGQVIPTQTPQRSDDSNTLLCLVPEVPSVGYRLLWLVPIADSVEADGYPPNAENMSVGKPNSFLEDQWTLENEFLQVTVDPETGDLSRVFDKMHQREVLSGSGNQLQAFQDQGQYWDAWNIDPDYAQHPLPPSHLQDLRWIERGPLRSCIRVIRQIGKSEFCQDYVLEAQSPLLQILTTVDWQEQHVLVKAAFPLMVESDVATYEIPCGAIARPTRPQTPHEQAKWEVPALRWADLSEEGYGVSLLNDCKYGYDGQPHQLRLTLLRGATWPDPEADRGHHEFTYALYPHADSWQQARTVHHGYELNQPLIVHGLQSSPMEQGSDSNQGQAQLPPIGSFLDLKAENWILMALKVAEDHPHALTLRGYECHGEDGQIQLTGDLAIGHPEIVDLLERPLSQGPQSIEPSTGAIAIAPWTITSIRCRSSLRFSFSALSSQHYPNEQEQSRNRSRSDCPAGQS